jgi:2-polyprenyl-6-methoxyphenol hydroxylase-like FAD-dependent oxidoreductase
MARSRKAQPATLSTRCAIAGGGPAGVLLGYLLARAGVDVIVLEKHADFFRDFRGDTVHPSTLEVMGELGLLDRFLERPHQEMRRVGGQVDGRIYQVADFARLPVRCPYIAFMPQWDFLDFLAAEGRKLPTFRLLMETEAEGLVERDGRVVGLRARTANRPLEIAADLVVGADGRDSVVRREAGLTTMNLAVPIDALWIAISRRPDDPSAALGRIAHGRLLVTIDRGDYWQCAFLIRKGALDAIRGKGLQALRDEIAIAAPFLKDRLGEIRRWDQVNLLTVRLERLEHWARAGLLCIGDAAHAMSPVGGVGVNLAVQDAVATANRLAGPLLKGAPTTAQLEDIQRRRQWPTEVIQGFQAFAHNRILSRILGLDRPVPTWPLKLLDTFPPLRGLPARFIGLGPRPEHISPALDRLFEDAT